MSTSQDDIFKDPHADETAEDPYLGPQDEDFEQSLGAHAPDPVAQARAPKKRMAIFMLSAAVLLVVGLLFLFGGDDPADVAEEEDSHRVDPVERAEVPEEEEEEDLLPEEDPSPAEDEESLLPEELRETEEEEEEEPEEDLIIDDPEDEEEAEEPSPEEEDLIFDVPDFDEEDLVEEPPDVDEGPDALDAEEVERLRQLEEERQRRAEQERIADSIQEAREAKEARLRSHGTQVYSGNVPEPPTGESRFDQDAAPAVTAGQPSPGDAAMGADLLGQDLVDLPGELSDATQADQFFEPAREGAGSPASVTRQAGDVLPGSQARVTLETEFISDLEGGGQVIATLTTPLISDRREILPAGTQAFGQASVARTGSTFGRDPRVSLDFDRFVTPRNEVVDDLTGYAADPETMSLTIPAESDRRYGERLLRGLASTAVDVGLGSTARGRRSTFEGPSVWDQTIARTQNRAATMIEGDVGDEQTVDAAVTLSQGTSFYLVFGL